MSVRLVSATNQNLSALVEQKKFREDRYYRRSVVPIRVSPLRERPEDLHPLAGYFLEEFCHRNNVKPKRIEPEVYDSLRDYRWPGTVPELRNVVERMAVLPNPTASRWNPSRSRSDFHGPRLHFPASRKLVLRLSAASSGRR